MLLASLPDWLREGGGPPCGGGKQSFVLVEIGGGSALLVTFVNEAKESFVVRGSWGEEVRDESAHK